VNVQYLSAFCTPIGYPHISYASDIYHALAAFLCLYGDEVQKDGYMFDINRPNASKSKTTGTPQKPAADRFAIYLNSMLKYEVENNSELRYELDGENLTSYSIRRGSASHAGAMDDLKRQAIANRGSWTIDAVATMYEYIMGTPEDDKKVGKYLENEETVVA
jgi:hypothetical protein